MPPRAQPVTQGLMSSQADDLCPCGVCWSKWPKENISAQVTDDDNTSITIDIEKAWEEMRRLLEVNDE
jgi:hypothetical protein